MKKTLYRGFSLLASTLLVGCVAQPTVNSRAQGITEYPSGGETTTNYLGDPESGIEYLGGPLLTGTTRLRILYYPKRPSYAGLIETFLNNLSGSPLADVLTSYSASDGNIPSGKFIVEPSEVIPLVNDTFKLDSDDYRTIIQDSSAPNDFGSLHLIVLADDRLHAGQICQGACDFHSSVVVDPNSSTPWSQTYKYAIIGDYHACLTQPLVDPTTGLSKITCQPKVGFAPNGDAYGDALLSRMWHEIAEAVTDPLPNFSLSTDQGRPPPAWIPEVGDLCTSNALTDGSKYPSVGYAQPDPDYPAANGDNANVHMGNSDYYLQAIWQNAPGGGCARRLVLNRPAVALGSSVTGDFDGDGTGDLLFRDTDARNQSVLTLDASGAGVLYKQIGTDSAGTEVAGIGNFDSDATADILWTHLSTNELHVRTGATTGGPAITLVAPSTISYAVQAVGDFNGDGLTDILFLDHITNQAWVWINSANIRSANFTPFTASDLKAVTGVALGVDDKDDTIGTGAFDSSGRSSVLWRNWNGGSKYKYFYWTMNGSAATSHSIDLSALDSIYGIANVNSDSTSDVVGLIGNNVTWLNVADGSTHTIGTRPGPTWRYAGGTRLHNGTVHALIWFDRTSGAVLLWKLNAAGGYSSTVMPVGFIAYTSDLVGY